MRTPTPLRALAAAMALVCLLAAPAAAVDLSGFYAGAKLGVAYSTNDEPDLTRGGLTSSQSGTDHSEANFALGADVGYDFDDAFAVPARLALEYLHRSEHEFNKNLGGVAAKVKTNIHTLLLNGYLDWHNTTDFVPYVTAGMGLAIHSIDADAAFFNPNSLDDSSTGFAWNIGLGLGYRLSRNIMLDACYRYAGYGTAKIEDNFGNKLEYDLSGHEFLAGLRFLF